MKPPILLRIYRSDSLEGVKQFDDGQVVIGRNSDIQLTLDDPAVSPLHAVIEERESGYYISDLGSTTGIMKNGVKTLDDKLESGDEIKIGPFKMQFFIGVPKPATPPAKDKSVPLASIPTAKNAAPKIPNQKPAPKAAPKIPSSAPDMSAQAAPPPTNVVHSTRSAAGAFAAVKSKIVKNKKTFAPPSAFGDAKEFIKPAKGTVVEVLVTWKERVIAARHFNERGEVTIGADPTSDIVVPLFTSGSKLPLVKIGTLASVVLTPEMPGELIRDQGAITTFAELFKQNRLRNSGALYELDVPQGEMVRIGFQGNLLSVYVRYVPETPKPLVAPLLDLTASEVTGVILATVVAMIFGLYMLIYAPQELEDEAKLEEPLRKAVVTFNAPRPKEVVQVVEEKPPEEKKVVKVVEKQKTSVSPTVDNKGKSGQTGEVAPKKTPDKEKKITSARPGGAIKTSPKEGANAKSEKPDPTKVGLLGVFGTKGTQKNLDKTFSGSGELQGLANSATGVAGNSENREGDNIGTKLKDTGAGGKGTATVGISGVGTKGKGTGNFGYGTGGIGTKGSVDIDVGGQEAEFTGSIDREAIRRIIQANKNAIRSCYERSLQRHPDLYGKLVIEWDIEEKGKVTRASVKSNNLGDDQVASCIVGRIKSLRFPEPPPDQVGRVTFPFVFSSQ